MRSQEASAKDDKDGKGSMTKQPHVAKGHLCEINKGVKVVGKTMGKLE